MAEGTLTMLEFIAHRDGGYAGQSYWKGQRYRVTRHDDWIVVVASAKAEDVARATAEYLRRAGQADGVGFRIRYAGPHDPVAFEGTIGDACG